MVAASTQLPLPALPPLGCGGSSADGGIADDADTGDEGGVADQNVPDGATRAADSGACPLPPSVCFEGGLVYYSGGTCVETQRGQPPASTWECAWTATKVNCSCFAGACQFDTTPR